MSDLRQGVTETQHEVLDLIEANQPDWSELPLFVRIFRGAARAQHAWAEVDPERRRAATIEAAALLISAADDMKPSAPGSFA